MPHFGLMDENELGPVEGPLQRARLHIRGGRRRLRQGKIAAGIVTLADALSAAMQGYIAAPRRGLTIQDGENLSDDRTAYAVLVRSGVLDGTFDYDSFDRVVERALQQEMRGFDHQGLVRGLEQVMTQLGVMPFDETSLPSEDPATF
ncbi:MAG: hypothetical protein A2X56_06475 [Nitrospirae bacterium GWC2_57_13]|jgi:hypothetical protein|nr:MAG: hypothetical protein A2X56_06475 [Nitrospirae bacterium GWC2_57_13]HAR44629.1 hypothetical protein [Nitrospiraceae bacterium]